MDSDQTIASQLAEEHYSIPNTDQKNTDIGLNFKANEIEKPFAQNIAIAGREPLTPNLYPSSIAKIYACGICSMAFNTRADLYTHNKQVHNHRLFSCHFCDKLFTRSSSLRTHVRVHTGERPYQCSECGKCFTQLSNVLQHNRDVHIRDKRFKCTLCGRGFSRLETLQCHVRVHTGERIYKCDICSKSFSQRANLKVHMRIHRGEKTRPMRKQSETRSLWTPMSSVEKSPPSFISASNGLTSPTSLMTSPMTSPNINITTNQIVISSVTSVSSGSKASYSSPLPLESNLITCLPKGVTHRPLLSKGMPPLSPQNTYINSPTLSQQALSIPSRSPIFNFLETVEKHARREKDQDLDYRPFLCVSAINILFSVTVTSLIYDRLETRIKENLRKLF